MIIFTINHCFWFSFWIFHLLVQLFDYFLRLFSILEFYYRRVSSNDCCKWWLKYGLYDKEKEPKLWKMREENLSTIMGESRQFWKVSNADDSFIERVKLLNPVAIVEHSHAFIAINIDRNPCYNNKFQQILST